MAKYGEINSEATFEIQHGRDSNVVYEGTVFLYISMQFIVQTDVLWSLRSEVELNCAFCSNL